MSLFICPNCNHESHIFGHDGAARMAQDYRVPLLGEVPLHADICKLSDSGKPIVISQPDSPFAAHYRNITKNIFDRLESISSTNTTEEKK